MSPAQTMPQNPARNPNMADAARFVAEQPAEAARRLRAVLRDDPHNAEAHRLLGRALRLLGQDA